MDNQGRGFRFLSAMRLLLGTDGVGGAMLAYLTHIVPRLAAIRELLKPGGSIYLHCDPHASHYLKLAMDSVFGADNSVRRVGFGMRDGESDGRGFFRGGD